MINPTQWVSDAVKYINICKGEKMKEMRVQIAKLIIKDETNLCYETPPKRCLVLADQILALFPKPLSEEGLKEFISNLKLDVKFRLEKNQDEKTILVLLNEKVSEALAHALFVKIAK